MIDPSDKIVSQINVEGLKKEVEEVVGYSITSHESPDADPAILESYWHNVLEFEKAPWTTFLDELIKVGMELPSPEDVPDDDIHAQLWRVIDKCAQIGLFLSDTDHLSDRELYKWLFREGLREHCKALSGGAWHTSPIGSGDEESMLVHFTYYSNPRDRKSWLKSFPDYIMPEPKKKPYNRDRHLPS